MKKLFYIIFLFINFNTLFTAENPAGQQVNQLEIRQILLRLSNLINPYLNNPGELIRADQALDIADQLQIAQRGILLLVPQNFPNQNELVPLDGHAVWEDDDDAWVENDAGVWVPNNNNNNNNDNNNNDNNN